MVAKVKNRRHSVK